MKRAQAKDRLPRPAAHTAGQSERLAEQEGGVELEGSELEERIVPKLASNHNQTFLVDS
jgi:hypothetical protein